jgi:Calcium binding
MRHTTKKSGSPRFRVGNKVRVKHNVIDPDFPDMPLGGWSGTIKEVTPSTDEVTYEIEWDRRTLAGMHPVYHKRCERDGLDVEAMGLGEEDIEIDDGTPIDIEPPTLIETPALLETDQDDRIGAVFGLTHDDLVPCVDYKSQRLYYHYLLSRLTFPFRARFRKKISRDAPKLVRLTVAGLYDFDDYDVNNGYGLIGVGKEPGGEVEFPLIEIEDIQDSSNRQLIRDYAYWLANW